MKTQAKHLFLYPQTNQYMRELVIGDINVGLSLGPLRKPISHHKNSQNHAILSLEMKS
jgi:hypothetical protein